MKSRLDRTMPDRRQRTTCGSHIHRRRDHKKTAAPATPWLISGSDSDMPYDRFTQEQTQKVFELLGINRQLDNGQRCIVSVDGAAPRLHRGVVTQVLENGYVVLLDGAATAQAVLRHQ